jgi:hypothetical protein
MSKYMMVDAISQFRMRYVIEVPDDCEVEDIENGKYGCTAEEYAMDSVTCEQTREYTQKHLGETIVSTREVTLEEAIEQYRKEEPLFGQWEDDTIIRNHITEIGFDREEYEKQEQENWKVREKLMFGV